MWDDEAVIWFSSSDSTDLQTNVANALESFGLKVKQVEKPGCLLVSAPDALYYREAEFLQMLKKRKNSHIMEEFSAKEKEEFEGWNEVNFFPPSERGYLLFEMLDAVPCPSSILDELRKNSKQNKVGISR